LEGISEYKLTKFLIKNLKETDIFYDIGANYGFYSFLGLEFCQEVHSFEPISYIFENLEENFKNIPNIFLNNIAIFDRNGLTFLYINIMGSGGSTIIEEVKNRLIRKSNKIEVQTITLDDYVKNHSKPTIIKLDVEGAESQVIGGGKEFFKNNSPVISIEVWPKGKGGEISMKAVEKLRNLGYQSYFLNLAGDLEKIDGDLSEKVDSDDLTNDNFIFLKN